MANWIKCTAYEDTVRQDDSPTIFVNLDNVCFMLDVFDHSRLLFIGEKEDDEDAGLLVHGTPEKLLAEAKT